MSHTRFRVWVVLKVPSVLDLQEPMWGAQELQAGFHGGHLLRREPRRSPGP